MTNSLSDGADCPPAVERLHQVPCSARDFWAPAFEAVPRRLFLPELIRVPDTATGTSVPIDRAHDPEGWLPAAEADIPIVTRWDDGDHQGTAPGTVPTGSAAMPSLVADMLADLDAERGHRIFEGGTGSGWEAGLLAWRLGDANVFTSEIDRAVGNQAKRHLRAAGLHPVVHIGDAAKGWPHAAPYDRIILTCGLRRIPYPLVRQTRPGGIILARWRTHHGSQDALVKLTVRHDGTASGPFRRAVESTNPRPQRPVGLTPPADEGTVVESTTTIPLPSHADGEPFPFAAGLRLPDVTHAIQPQGDGRTLWLYNGRTSSWSSATYRDGEPTMVRQCGGRRLWQEFEAAYEWWVSNGEPGLDRLGLTVLPDGSQRAWLDEPAQSWAI